MYNVYLVQPNFDFGPTSTQEYYLPYSVGILWSYVSQFYNIKSNFKLGEIFFKRENIKQIISRLETPKIVAFSCYVWNWEYNKELAKQIKKDFPASLIVFGGPQVTNKPFQKLFFKNHPYVDCIVNGEGEYAFKDILDTILTNGIIKKVYTSARIDNLDSIPSPYLTGVFDQLLSNDSIKWQMILETNRGCPFSCTFCDWGSVTYSKIKKFNLERVFEELEWASKHKIEYIAIPDANFGIFIERDKQIAIEIDKLKRTTGYPRILGISWNKTSSLKVLEIAKILGPRGLTVSVQSMSDEVLTEIKRKNMDLSNMAALLPKCETAGVPVYSELILGLPFETKESWRLGHFALLNHNQHSLIDVYLTMILENSELNSVEQIEKHQLDLIEVENYLSGKDDLTDQIIEKQKLIRATKYMDISELVESFMFSWMITTFHYIGYSQIYSRYLNNSHSISYEIFYNNLYDFIIKSNGILNKEYKNVKNIINSYLNTGRLDPSSKFKSGTNIIWNSTKVFPIELTQVQTELENFVRKSYIISEIDELVIFQKHFNVDFEQKYPYQIDIDSNIYNQTFFSKKSSGKTTLILDSIINETTIDEFCRRFYTGRRSGSSKVKIKLDK